MQRILTSILLVSILFGCDAPQPKPLNTSALLRNNKSVDTIFLDYASDKQAYFYYSGKLTGDKYFLNASQSIKVVSKDPVFFIEGNRLQTPFVLYPGDSIHIQNNENAVRLLAKDTIRQNELDFFRKLVEVHGPVINVFTTSYVNTSVTPAVRETLITEKYLERLAFLQAYKKKYSLSKKFVQYCQEVFQCAKLNERLSMYYPGFDKTKLASFYKDSFSTFHSFLSNPALLHHSLFRYALLNYARYFTAKGDKRPWLFLDGLSAEQLTNVWDSIPVHFRGEVRAFLQTQTIKAMSNMNVSLELMQQRAVSVEVKEYETYLAEFLKEKGVVQPPVPIFDQPLYDLHNDSTTLKAVIPKDSLVVIDLWASWCVPCIQEFSYIKKLEEKLMNKPLKFIRLSTDEHKSEWLQAIERYQLKHNSYLIKGFNYSKMKSEWKVTSIPRFIILNNDRVIDMDAPHPSEGDQLLQRLNSLLVFLQG